MNFEFWINSELSKGGHFRIKVLKIDFIKNVNYNECAPKLIFFNEKKIEKDLVNF